MKYADEYRDPDRARATLASIDRLLAKIDPQAPLAIMEVCGGHTHTIFRYGLGTMLPDAIELVHGPGCPVCVLPTGRIDDCVALAERPEVIFATFGDPIRVPGSTKSLMEAKAAGADVRVVYSPLDALGLAEKNPGREVVFFALGFETTMPSTALTVLEAQRRGVDNFSLFVNHITIIPTLAAILEAPGCRIDGFVGPGHVSMVIGTEPYRFIAEDHHRPLVVAGFEPLDVLQAIAMVVAQIAEGRAEIENQYARVVLSEGNRRALSAVAEVFELREQSEWRGLGMIAHSGIRLRERYAAYDAERRFAIAGAAVADPAVCQCGEVLTGAIKPWQCAVFGTRCTPDRPLGALMVSSEGACAASFAYGGKRPNVAERAR